MGENITITFTGIDEVSSVIADIVSAMDGLNPNDPGPEAADVEITINSDQMEPEIEQVMWEMLDVFKGRAVEDEAEFLLNL